MRTRRSFWVLKLLYPASLTVRPLGTARLHCESVEGKWIVEGAQSTSITANSPHVQITGPADGPVHCTLEIANVIRREYFGTFVILGNADVVVPVVTMDCEIAASSIVQAELPVFDTPLSALAAQAIASRSRLCAATPPRHNVADFCDTTHCQFLRSPALAGGRAMQAVSITSGLVLSERGRVLPARYSAACGGMTEAGLDTGYQYISVCCEVCRRAHTPRRGHGWGLCQEGAIGLARLGWSWRAILAKYYPNAIVTSNVFPPAM